MGGVGGGGSDTEDGTGACGEMRTRGERGGLRPGPSSYTRVARGLPERFWSVRQEVIPRGGVTPDVWALPAPSDTHAQVGSHPRSLLRLDRPVSPVPAPASGPCQSPRRAQREAPRLPCLLLCTMAAGAPAGSFGADTTRTAHNIMHAPDSRPIIALARGTTRSLHPTQHAKSALEAEVCRLFNWFLRSSFGTSFWFENLLKSQRQRHAPHTYTHPPP